MSQSDPTLPLPDTSEPITTQSPQDGATTSPGEPQAGPSSGGHIDQSGLKKEKSRVRFNSNADASPYKSAVHQQPEQPKSPIIKPRPSVLRTTSGNSINFDYSESEPEDDHEQRLSAAAAQKRARRVADNLQDGTTANEERESMESDRTGVASEAGSTPSAGPDHEEEHTWTEKLNYSEDDRFGAFREQAHHLVRSHTQRAGESSKDGAVAEEHETTEVASASKPSEFNDGCWDGLYTVPQPETFRSGVLAELLKLYNAPREALAGRPSSSNWSTTTLNHGGTELDDLGSAERGRSGKRASVATRSGSSTPNTGRRKWYEQNRSQETLSTLIGASARLANPGLPQTEDRKSSPGKKWMPGMHKGHKRNGSANRVAAALRQKEDEARITVHIAETLFRQEFLVKMCRALMLYGAPTHRLEEYLSMSARVLEIDGQFLYVPGCMIINFDDKSTHTTEVRIVRTAQGIDLGKLKDVHRIYKEVMHDVCSVEEASERLDDLMKAKEKFNPWLRVLVFGLTSVTASPFSFKARLIDLPMTFVFGCLVGFLQLIVATKSNLYSNVFEVSAVVLVSFLARLFGSLQQGNLFCFSALAQGGIVMLLPGYLVLCSSLEIQSRAIVPGSIRIVYAVIYSLLLGFGITVGASIYGLFDESATSDTQCHDPMDPYIAFAFVPPFVLCITILYQAKWRQMPIMIVIAFAGYIVNYFSSRRFAASPAIANTLGALAVGLLANLYSRVRHGVAAAILIPAVFTQVPGSLASTGGLVSGITTADMLTGTNTTDPATGAVAQQQGQDHLNAEVFQVAASMIQIAIGLAVGLFLSALIVYPFGKRRSGLFSL